jgi:hypothetical protein
MELMNGRIRLNYVKEPKRKGIKTTHQHGAVWGPEAQ